MLRSRLESLGTYLPERIVTTRELVKQLKVKPLLDPERFTGIKERRHRAEAESTYTISLEAMRDCLANSRYDPENLDIIISCSISRFGENGDTIYEPSVSLLLKEQIGATRAKFFSLTNACAGMGTGVHILDNMIRSGAVSNGMVVSGECITGISDTAVREICEPLDPQIGSLTVGDAGAAVILEATTKEDEGIEYTHFVTAAEFSDLCRALPSHETGTVAMYTDSHGIHQKALDRLARFVHEVFKRERDPETADEWDYQITWAIPHQTGTKAMQDGQRKLRQYFNIEIDYANRILISKYIEKFGNTASTSNFLVLSQALKEGLIKRGDKVLLLIQASGIVLGIISVKIGEIKVSGREEH